MKNGGAGRDDFLRRAIREREREKAIDNESVHRGFRAGRSRWARTLRTA